MVRWRARLGDSLSQFKQVFVSRLTRISQAKVHSGINVRIIDYLTFHKGDFQEVPVQPPPF